MRKPTLLSLATFSVLLMSIMFMRQVSAHTLKVDGPIGVTMHISPDDAPVAGQKSQIGITVEDKSGQFTSFSYCECSMYVERQGEVISSTSLTASGAYATVPYVFPSSGIYKLHVHGSSPDDSSYRPFSVTFTYNVGGGIAQSSKAKAENALRAYVPLVVMVSVASMLLLALVPIKYKRL